MFLKKRVILLSKNPSGFDEERYLFEHPIQDPTELNERLKIQQKKQDLSYREQYYRMTHCLVRTWTWFLIVLTGIQMIMSVWNKGLVPSEFIALVTTTTGTIFGLFYLVGRYLFPETKSKDKKK